jgi:hypothetical protein
MHDLYREQARSTNKRPMPHRTAAEHNEKGEDETGNWHSQLAVEFSERAYQLAEEAHTKSGQIVSP